MRVLVTGGRSYRNQVGVHAFLNLLHKWRGIELLMEGGATGADELARRWAKVNGIPHVTYPADWKRYGPSAAKTKTDL